MVKKLARFIVSFCFLVLSVFPIAQADDELNVAVTASFKPVLEVLAEHFYQSTGIQLNLSSASTGILYQQSVSGAPFDVFFAADSERPQALVDKLSLDPSLLVPYAIGRLVLVSQTEDVVSLEDITDYKKRLVLANPKHAPYGVAAEQTLQQLGFSGSKVLANNVAQARQYLQLGLADVGLIAASVAQGFTNVVEVPDNRYDEIIQKLVVLNPSAQTEALMEFFASDLAQSTLIEFGYEPPL
jgi:molybdate transport system substrate-binding protein